jgi:hypothetical protein
MFQKTRVGICQSCRHPWLLQECCGALDFFSPALTPAPDSNTIGTTVRSHGKDFHFENL